MTNREKIIELFHKTRKADVICNRDGAELEWSDLEVFYHAVRNEALEQAASVCDGWLHADGDRCAEAIRATKVK